MTMRKSEHTRAEEIAPPEDDLSDEIARVRRAMADTLEEARTGLAEMEARLNAASQWPDPVDGRELLDQVAAAIRRFCVLPDHAAQAIGLWVLHAHGLDAFRFSPILLLTSPTRRCGKTTTLRVLRKLVPRPISAANITPAALFRTIETMQPTIILDEADALPNRGADLRAIFNAGHGRDDAFIMRVIGGEPRAFSIWSAKIIAGIGRRAGTIEDRAIIVRLRRKLRSEAVEQFRPDRAEHLVNLCRQAARWATDNLDALRAADPDTPPELHDRAADSWRPLLAIADLAGGDWPTIARRAAIALSGGELDLDDDAPGAQLLADIRRVFAEQGGSHVTPKDLVTGIGRLDEAAFGRGAKLSTKALATLLHPYGIESQGPMRIRGAKPARYYLFDDFADAWARYLPDGPVLSVTSVTPRKINGLGEIPSVTKAPFVTDENGENALKINDVTDITDREGTA